MISFRQENWLLPYIDFYIDKRKAANNEFENKHNTDLLVLALWHCVAQTTYLQQKAKLGTFEPKRYNSFYNILQNKSLQSFTHFIQISLSCLLTLGKDLHTHLQTYTRLYTVSQDLYTTFIQFLRKFPRLLHNLNIL